MNLLLFILEAILQIFTSWTLAYHLALLINLPVKFIVLPFLIILGIVIKLFWSRWNQLLSLPLEKRALLGILGLSLATGIFTLVISRPDADDLVYFHRSLVQLQHLDRPFILTDTLHNQSSLPPFAITHVMTSYEPLTALVAVVIGIDPLSAYHNLSPFVAGILLPSIYVLLYQHFKVDKYIAILAASFAILFLIVDGNLHRSFGNFALVRLWQGKAILVTLLLPFILLLAYRYFNDATFLNYILVSMAGISAVGLSSSGIFLIPIFIFAISIASLFSYGFSYTYFKRAILLNTASFYCLGIGISLLVGLLPPIPDTPVWYIGPSNWQENLKLVIGDEATLIRNLIILIALPLISLERPGKIFLIFLTGVLSLIFANPVLGPFWFEKIRSGAYWRLAYLYPIPWCAGLIIPASVGGVLGRRQMILRMSVALVVLFTTFNAYQGSVLSPPAGASPVYFNALGEYKLHPAQLAFARSVSDRLQYKSLLAPEEIVVTLGLINPTVKFEATRTGTTVNIFTGVGRITEGVQREAAQMLVTDCELSPTKESAFLNSLDRLDAVVIRENCEPLLSTALFRLERLTGKQWIEVEHNNGYILIIRKP